MVARPANRILQEGNGHLLTRPVGRPPNAVRRSYASFSYQAASWIKPRHVVAKVEWHSGELSARRLHRDQSGATGRERRRVLQQVRNLRTMDQGRQGCDQMDAGFVPILRRQRRASPAAWDGLQSRQFPAHAGHPEPIKDWSLITLKEKLIKIGAKVLGHAGYVAFQMAEVAIPGTCLPTFCG
jgi:hypothetical protein